MVNMLLATEVVKERVGLFWCLNVEPIQRKVSLAQQLGTKCHQRRLWRKPNAKCEIHGYKSAGEIQGMLVVYKKECFARVNSHSLWVINVPSKQSVLFGDGRIC